MVIIQRLSGVRSPATQCEVEWEVLAQELLAHAARGPEYTEYFGLSRSEQNRAKDGPLFGPFSGKRKDAEVETVTLLVGDLDHYTGEDLDKVLGELAGVECVVYTSHSSRHTEEKGEWAIRIVAPLVRAVPVGELGRLRRVFFQMIGARVDPSTDNPSRIYYMPSSPPGGEPCAMRIRGLVVDPAWFDGEVASVSAPAVEVQYDRAAIEKALGAIDWATGGSDIVEPTEMARRILAGEALGSPKEGRDAAIYQAVKTVCYAGGSAGVPSLDVVVDVLRPSLSSMVLDEGLEACIATKVADKYAARVKRMATAKGEKKEANDSLLAALKGLTPAEPPDSEDDWFSKLDMRVDKDGNEHVRNTASNAGLILEHSPEWVGVLRYDELRKVPRAVGGPVPMASINTYATAVSNWFARSKWNLQVKAREIKDQILEVSYRHAYDPLKEYLEGLVWDGTPRIGRFAVDYCNALTHEGTASIVATMGEKWLIAGAARGLCPGSVVQTALSFQGGQGIYKSRMLAALGGEFFSSSPIDIGSKDGMQMASYNWIVELSEFASIKGKEVEKVKAFLSENKDTFRPPYGVAPEIFLRRSIYACSTNSQEYLQDDTGNRRFWCLEVGPCGINLAAVKRDRDQLWAEAVHRFKAGEAEAAAADAKAPGYDEDEARSECNRWWLSKAEAREAESIAVTKREVSTTTEQVESWWFGLSPESRPDRFTVRDVMEYAFQMEPKEILRESRQKASIGKACAELGFTSRRNARGKFYAPTEELRTAPKRALCTLPQAQLHVIR